jgi:hypothetical protein
VRFVTIVLTLSLCIFNPVHSGLTANTATIIKRVLKGGKATTPDFTARIARQELEVRRIWERTGSYRAHLRGMLDDQHVRMASAIDNRAFLDDFFDEETIRHLSDSYPKLKNIWRVADSRAYAKILKEDQHYIDDALVTLYGKEPEGYGFLFSALNPSTAKVGELRRHIGALVKSQLDRDASSITRAMDSTKMSGTVKESLRNYLDALPASNVQRRSAALPIIHRWAVEGSALIGEARVADLTARRVYSLSDVIVVAGSGGTGTLATALVSERLIGPDVAWSGTREVCAIFHDAGGSPRSCVCQQEPPDDGEDLVRRQELGGRPEGCMNEFGIRWEGEEYLETIVLPLHARPNSSGTDWYCGPGYKTKYDADSNRAGCEPR